LRGRRGVLGDSPRRVWRMVELAWPTPGGKEPPAQPRRRQPQKHKQPRRGEGPGLNLPSSLFLLDGRRLDKITDFRFRERRFPLQIFRPLQAVDRRCRTMAPQQQLEARVNRQRPVELAQAREQRAAQHLYTVEEATKLLMAQEKARCDECGACTRERKGRMLRLERHLAKVAARLALESGDELAVRRYADASVGSISQ